MLLSVAGPLSSVLKISGQTSQIEFSSAITLTYDPSEPGIACSGYMRASDFFVEDGSSGMSVKQLMHEHAQMKADVAAMKMALGMMPSPPSAPNPTPPPPPPPPPPSPPPPTPLPPSILPENAVTGCDHVSPDPTLVYLKTSVNAASTSCDSVCSAAGMTCSRMGLKAITLASSNPSCAFEKCALGSSYGCIECGPSDSSNDYCWPGISGGSAFYYHSSWSDSKSFTCSMIPDRTKTSLCPCI